jgi:hypothetical protein
LDEASMFILKRHLQALEDEDFLWATWLLSSRHTRSVSFLGLDPIKVITSFDAVY